MKNLQPTLYAVSILSGKKNQSFPLKIRNKTRESAFTTFIQNTIANSGHSDQTRKRNRIGKEEVKLSLFADDMKVSEKTL